MNRYLSPPWNCKHIFVDFFETVSVLPVWSCKWLPRNDSTLAHNLYSFGMKLGSWELCILKGSIWPPNLNGWILHLPIIKKHRS